MIGITQSLLEEIGACAGRLAKEILFDRLRATFTGGSAQNFVLLKIRTQRNTFTFAQEV